jgi:putative tricarboxylic transport membrane protein
LENHCLFTGRIILRKINLNFLSAIIWLVLATAIATECLRLGIGGFRSPDAGLFPFLTAALLGLFSLWLLIDSLLQKNRHPTENRIVWGKETKWRNILLTLGALVAYAFALNPIGYLLTTFLFLLFLFRQIGPQRWIVAILGAAFSSLLSYAIFHIWLQTQLPDGFFFSWVRNLL